MDGVLQVCRWAFSWNCKLFVNLEEKTRGSSLSYLDRYWLRPLVTNITWDDAAGMSHNSCAACLQSIVTVLAHTTHSSAHHVSALAAWFYREMSLALCMESEK